jgi:CBS-domain-containing membrane protein
MKIKDCMKRKVYSISHAASIVDAAHTLVQYHIGLLPVVDDQGRLVGVIGMKDVTNMVLPTFVHLFEDLDFVHDFGVVEKAQPGKDDLKKSVKQIMRKAIYVEEDCGLLRAITLLYRHDLHDLPVVTADGLLTGIASRVDIGTAILSAWITGPE